MSLSIPSIGEFDQAQAVEVSDKVFGADYNEGLVHQLVTTVMTNNRAGTRAQKNRAAVNGGGKKPWRQKGTGHARAGTSRGPIWRSGGVTFAAQPKDYNLKLNKKMYRAGMRSILSELLRQERIFISEDMVPEQAKTKLVAEKLKQRDALGRTLIISEQVDDTLKIASKNLRKVTVTSVDSIDPVVLVKSDKVLVSGSAVKNIEVWLT